MKSNMVQHAYSCTLHALLSNLFNCSNCLAQTLKGHATRGMSEPEAALIGAASPASEGGTAPTCRGGCGVDLDPCIVFVKLGTAGCFGDSRCTPPNDRRCTCTVGTARDPGWSPRARVRFPCGSAHLSGSLTKHAHHLRLRRRANVWSSAPAHPVQPASAREVPIRWCPNVTFDENTTPTPRARARARTHTHTHTHHTPHMHTHTHVPHATHAHTHTRTTHYTCTRIHNPHKHAHKHARVHHATTTASTTTHTQHAHRLDVSTCWIVGVYTCWIVPQAQCACFYIPTRHSICVVHA